MILTKSGKLSGLGAFNLKSCINVGLYSRASFSSKSRTGLEYFRNNQDSEMLKAVRQGQRPKKRIVLIDSDNLIVASVASLLRNRSDLEVICTSFEFITGMDELIRMSPDVLILEDKVMIEHLEELVQFIENCPKLRAIVLNSNSNQIQVFDEEIVQVSHIEDFLEIL